MSADDHPPELPTHYEIRVAGHLAAHWSAWFEGMTVVTDVDGTTVLRGRVVDQSALHGLLRRLRDIGIPLVSLTPVPPDTTAGPRARTNPDGDQP